MAPREVIIGAIVVSAQLLYSAVYPFAEQTLKRLPQQADEFWRGLRAEIVSTNEMMSSLLQDVAGEPPAEESGAAKLKGVQQEAQDSKAQQKHAKTHLSRRELIEQALRDRMMPHMSTISQALRDTGKVEIANEKNVEMSWDAHRISDAEVPWAYVIRIHVKNKSPRQCVFQCIARFYVLRAPDGRVFPIQRLVEGLPGPAAFTLNAGESIKYAAIFYTKYKTVEASGGVLLENRTQADGKEVHRRFFNATLPTILPAKSKGVSLEEVHNLLASYHFMGVVDFRDVTYI